MLMLSTASPQPQRLLLYTAFLLLSLSRDAPHLHVVAAAASPFSFSFDFSSPSTYRSDDLHFEGDAAVHDQLVDLTCDTSSPGQSTSGCEGMGRMSYNHLVPFYDHTTGQVASFTTRFSFVIDGNGSNQTGYGMAFFLSSYPSRLPALKSGGGDLGLDGGDLGAHRFVAVEFDTFSNTWDPCNGNDHIAIDIDNTRASTNPTCLGSFILEGSMTASITFNSSTNMLVASLHFDDHPSRDPAQVSMHLPNLATSPNSLLPPEVAVGFSAATGSFFELHQILSWCFESTLATRSETSAPEAQPESATEVTAKGTGAPQAQPKPPRSVIIANETGAPVPQQKSGPVSNEKEKVVWCTGTHCEASRWNYTS